MQRKETTETVEAEIGELEHLDLSSLRSRWQDLTGSPAPKFFRRKFLMRAVAYQIQVKTYGGLDSKTKKRLRDIANAAKVGKDITSLNRIPIKPGTRLVREWQNTVHTVTVQTDSFEWNGERFSSLSAIAKVITGTNWNGHTFFGLKHSKKSKVLNAGRIHAS